ncbi:carboxymuconolactone decarboxylase family protein [Aldersonia kunmingensis]|uniref:carboxymuconolactone decarboxylase family protein n=1 Tax=Aldersonia kunmingensis TaxID=408066 RepID=UPI00082E7D16|nr:carboxymuconolactone decarboxylase family protein [Aldersonia kunmingensis]
MAAEWPDEPAMAATMAARLDFVFGRVWPRPGLSRRDRRFVTLACVCAADGVDEINDHVYAALASGDISAEEMLEFVLHFAVYCGWPKGAQAEVAVRTQAARLAAERGEDVAAGRPLLESATLGPTDHDARLAEGERCFGEINLVSPPQRDSPYFQAGILAFVFGHLWQRPNLGRRERRLTTIACVGVSDALGPIYSHVGSALESGDISADEMNEIILQFSAYSGFPKGRVLQQAADAANVRISLSRKG